MTGELKTRHSCDSLQGVHHSIKAERRRWRSSGWYNVVEERVSNDDGGGGGL